MTIAPFSIDVPDAVVEDLHRRLDATLWPQSIKGTGWDYGTDVDFLRDLCAYWRYQYDWRAQERALNAWPQYLVGVDDPQGDDLDIHCIHVPGQGPDPLPLVLTHGWPSSFFEMHKVIGPLSDPAAHGGDPIDAFHVVVPSLPGYGFSSQPHKRGMNAGQVAGLWVKLMARLGYDRFGAHGGDWGSRGQHRPRRRVPRARDRDPPDHAGPAGRRSHADARGAGLVGTAQGLPRRGMGLRPSAAHQTADGVVRPDRLTGRPGRLDHREVVAVERLRGRSGGERPLA